MSTVEVVLPAEYDNEWLLRVINTFDEVDIQVKFVKAPSPNYYYYPYYYPYWAAKSISPNSDKITVTNGITYSGTNLSDVTVRLDEAKAQADIDRQVAAYKAAYPEKFAKNQAAFDTHRESAAQLDAEDKYRPWYKGENYDPSKRSENNG